MVVHDYYLKACVPVFQRNNKPRNIPKLLLDLEPERSWHESAE